LDIPVIAAGWIVTRKDIDRMFSIWAKGVQMATLPLISKPSRAHEDFKYAVIHAGKDDIHEFNSSAIYPARRLRKSLIGADMVGEDLEKIRSEKRTCLRHCLHHCAYRDRIPGYAQICIMDALVRSTRWSDGSWLRFIWYPLDENWKNKITSELWITSPITIKEIFEILQRKTT
jgi:NAD(P)H-dependent flavin oxidoreductase YrpB (nitropropane dioxygenase family)